MPVTVRWPGWAKNPATSAWKVPKVGWVKQGPNATSRSASERGRLSVGIGGDSLADEPPMLACLALPGKPVNSASHHHRKPRNSSTKYILSHPAVVVFLSKAADAVRLAPGTALPGPAPAPSVGH